MSATATSTSTTVAAVELDTDQLEAMLHEYRIDNHAFGAQLGVRLPGRGGDVVIASGIDDGVNGDPETPMPTEGTFPIASVTKTFTSAVVLQLIEEGVIDLDDTLEAWVPGHPHAGEITIRQMLDHTSGMPDLDHADVARFTERIYADPEHVWRLEEVLREDAALAPFGPPPNEFHYSNAGYVALGLIIEFVTGRPVEEVFEERIVEPLGLRDTMLGLQRRVDAPTQHGWFHPDSGDPDTGDFDPELPRNVDALDLPLTAFLTFSSTTAGGISSTRDLLEWGETLYGGAFLGEDMNAELRSLHHVLVAMGFCPCDEDSDGPTTPIIGHDGRAKPLGTMVGLFHDDVSGATVVVRTNVPDVAYEAEYAFVQEVIDLVRAQA